MDFLDEHGVGLPVLTEDDYDHMDMEFSKEEIKKSDLLCQGRHGARPIRANHRPVQVHKQ
jgi:hypothetical protein